MVLVAVTSMFSDICIFYNSFNIIDEPSGIFKCGWEGGVFGIGYSSELQNFDWFLISEFYWMICIHTMLDT